MCNLLVSEWLQPTNEDAIDMDDQNNGGLTGEENKSKLKSVVWESRLL